MTACELSLTAMSVLWLELRLGPPPMIFELFEAGRAVEDHERLRRAVFADLRQRGLAHDDRLDPDLVMSMTLLSRSPQAIEVLGLLADGSRLCARGAADDRRAVVAERGRHSVRLSLVRPTALVTAMVDLIGTAPAGPGRSVSYPSREPDSPTTPAGRDREGGFLEQAHPAATGFAAQRMEAQAILKMPRTQVGIFTVIERNPNNGEVVHPALLWFDTPAGRYLGHVRQLPDGQAWTTYVPADNARLTRQLSGQLDPKAS